MSRGLVLHEKKPKASRRAAVQEKIRVFWGVRRSPRGEKGGFDVKAIAHKPHYEEGHPIRRT